MKHFLVSVCMAVAVLTGGNLVMGLAPVPVVTVAHAAVFDGPGLKPGADRAAEINGPVHMTLRQYVVNLLRKVLNFLALIAVVMILVAGIYLIVGLGSDDSKNKAKNIILYTILGLLVILFARVIVGFVTTFFT